MKYVIATAMSKLQEQFLEYLIALTIIERPGPTKYIVTVLLTIIALGLRLLILPVDAGVQYITFFPTVTLSAIFLGFCPGMLAAFLGMCFATFILTHPYYSISLHAIEHSLWANFVFLADSIVICITIDAMHRYRRQYAQELHESQKSRDQLNHIIDNLPDSMITVAHDGRIVRANKMAELFFGYTNAELLNMTVEELIPERYRNVHQHHRANYYTRAWYGPMGKRQFVALTKDGREPDVEINLAYNGTGAERAVTAILRDITERKSQEARILLDIKERKQQEEQLHQSEALFRTLAQVVPVGIFRNDVTGNCTYVNQQCCKIMGLPLENALGTNWFSVIHPEDRECVFDKWRTSVQQQQEVFTEFRLLRADGQVIWITIQTGLEKDSSGAVIGHVGIMTDITERKLIERHISEQSRLLDLIFTHSIENLVVLDQDYNFLRVSDSYARNAGTTVANLIGRNHFAVYPSNFEQELEPYRQAKKIYRRSERPFIFPDHPEWGVTYWDLGMVPMLDTDGEIEFFLFTLTNVTARKHNEIALIEAKQAAESANRAKSAFLANMSHEIRTPMNTVIGLGNLIAESELQPIQHDWMQKILTAGQSLLGIIDNILDFSKIEAGQLTLEAIPFHLEKIFEQVSNIISLKAEEKHLELLFQIPIGIPNILIGDPLRLQQVLINLVNNAIKFTHHGEVVLCVQDISRSAHECELRFSVRDSGIGLTSEQISRLFQPFHQADTSTTRQYGGTGLGLTISSLIVKKMAGELSVTSKFGEGSVFSFTAVFERPPVAVEPRLVPTPELVRGMRILVVDDNPSSCEVFCDMLRSMALDGLSVLSGEAALIELKRPRASGQRPYDVVLLDWFMPEMDGLETARRIQLDPELPRPPLIIMATAHGRQQVQHQAREVGVAVVLSKPVMPVTLLETLLRVIDRDPKIEEFVNGEIQDLSPLHGARILVVEDHDINWEVAQNVLCQVGVITNRAIHGRMALALCADSPPPFDAVLMDLQMPEMDGYEATRELRQRYSAEQLPIIAMTAHAMISERARCLALGMNDYLTKPFNKKNLFAILMSHLKPTHCPRGLPELPKNKTPKLSWPDCPGIDRDAAMNLLSGDAELFRRLLINFYERFANFDPQLDELVAQNNWDTAKRLVHGIKGVAGSLSAMNLVQAALDLEAALNDVDLILIASRREKLRVELARLFSGIAALIVNHADTPPIEIAAVVDNTLWDDLQHFLEPLAAGDIAAYEEWQKLSQRLHGRIPETTLSHLNSLIDNLDFERSAVEIKALLANL